MKTWIRISGLVVLLTAVVAAAFGQTQSATVRGSVMDASGAVIPGASLTLTNIDQNRPWQSESNASGAYIFQQIPPGNSLFQREMSLKRGVDSNEK